MSTFGDLIELFKVNGLSTLLLPVRKLGIQSSDSLFAAEPLIDKLRTLHSRCSTVATLPVKREDFPLVVASSQASLRDAFSANSSQAQAHASVSALINDFTHTAPPPLGAVCGTHGADWHSHGVRKPSPLLGT